MDTLPLGGGRPCLRPNVSHDEALAEFSRGGWVGRLARGPLRRLADIYIPHRVYRVAWRDGEASKVLFLAVDCVCADFDSYMFPAVPAGAELIEVRTRNCPEPRLSKGQARSAALDRARRLAYERGLLRIKDLSLAADLVLPELLIPYWAGFFGRGERASRVEVLDAVRRRQEGGKLRAFVAKWLTIDSCISNGLYYPAGGYHENCREPEIA